MVVEPMVIDHRASLTPELHGKFVVLPRDVVAEAVAGILHRLHGAGNQPAVVVQRDVSEAELVDVTLWLETLGIDGDVRVYWVSVREGLEMAFADFAFHWDNLCFPSSDDVWIVGTRNEGWILEWDHEEIFRMYR